MKRHSYDGYSIYLGSFNSFLEAVYPVGVTTNQSCFTRKLDITYRDPFCPIVWAGLHFSDALMKKKSAYFRLPVQVTGRPSELHLAHHY